MTSLTGKSKSISNAGNWHHIYAPTKGIVVDRPPTLLDKEASPYCKGIWLRDGEIISDYGYVKYPIPSNTQTNKLSGSLMFIDSFYRLDGLAYMYALTTREVYVYNSSLFRWENKTQGMVVSDCEDAWAAEADVTCTADTNLYMLGAKSSKSVLGAAFTTGLASSIDFVDSSTDIKDYTGLHFWIRSSVATVAGDLVLRISDEVAGGTGGDYEDLDIPALSAGVWTAVSLTIATPADYDNLRSVALVRIENLGAQDVYIDDIKAVNSFTGTTDNRFSVATYDDKWVVTNGVDQPQYTDGSGNFADLPTALNAGSITTAEVVLAFKDHLILMCTTENASDAPQRVTWSDLGKTDVWVGGTAGYQDLVDDASWIVGAETLSENEVAIYKERSIVIMTWVGGHTPYRFKTMITGTGALSKEAVTDVGGQHLVLGPDTFFMYKGGNEIEILDDNVRGLMYSRLNTGFANRAFITYVEEIDEVQIWIPTESENPDEVWCMNFIHNNWYIKGKVMTGFGFYRRQDSAIIGSLIGNIGEQNYRIGDLLTKEYAPITLHGDVDGNVFQAERTSLNNDGAAIENTFETPDFTLPDTPDYMNKFMRVAQLIIEARGQSVTCYWSDDGGSTWSPTQGNGQNTISLDSTYRIYQQDFETTSRKIRFKFNNSSLSSGFYIRYYGIYWIPRSGRR